MAIIPYGANIYQSQQSLNSYKDSQKKQQGYGSSMIPTVIQSQDSINDYKNYKKLQSPKQVYENPISREQEKKLAILSGAGTSLGIGFAVGITSTLFAKGLKLPIGLGVAAAAVSAALLIPVKLYQTKVNAFTREKEMNVFSREKELKSNLLEDVHEEVKDKDVPLDKKIDHYTQIKMADNGQGVILKTM